MTVLLAHSYRDSPLEYSPPPEVKSAQMAELIVLPRGCQPAKDQRVITYADGRYALGEVLDFGMLWKQR